MKKYLVIFATVGAFFGPLRPAFAGIEVTGSMMDRSAQAVSVSQDFDMSGFNRFSVQAVYSDGTPTAKSFTDGAKATANITVSSAAYVFNSTPTLKINGVTISYTPVATATGTAKVISTAINANASLNTVIVATNGANTGTVVYATASAVGTSVNSYIIESSSAAALLPSNNTFSGGQDTDVSLTADSISETSHGFTTGLRVLMATSSGTAPTGLTTGTTYFVIKIDDNSYKLATTANNAAAGTAVDITAQAGGAWVSVGPLALAVGSSAAKWQASNDGTNFTDLSVSSVTTSSVSSGGNQIWDFSTYGYRYLRFNFVGPTSGGVNLGIKLHGKKE